MPDPVALRATLRAFGRDVSLYAVQGILLRLAQFALLPVYLAVLTPEDFGVLALATVFGVLAGVFLGAGLDAAILRFYYEWSAPERRRALGTVWLFSVASAFLLTLAMEWIGRFAAGILVRQVPFTPYLRLALWTAFFTSFEAIPLALLRVRQQSGTYAALSLTTFFFREALKLYVLLGLRRGVLGVLEGGFIASAALAIVYTGWMLVQARPALSASYLRGPLRFSLPRIPGGVIETLAATLDRIMLEKAIPVGQVGTYEVARRFGNLVRDVNLPLKTAWVPYAIRLGIERPDAPTLLARVSTYYVSLLVTVGLAVSLLAGDVIALFGGAWYAEAAALVPLFALVFLLDGAYGLLGTTLYIAKKTSQVSAASTLSFTVLLAAYLILVPPLRIPGAFLAMLLYRAVHGAVLLWLAGRYYPVPYEWRKIATMAAAALLAFALGTVLHPVGPWAGLVLKSGLTAVFALIVGLWIVDGRAVYAILVAHSSSGGAVGTGVVRPAKRKGGEAT